MSKNTGVSTGPCPGPGLLVLDLSGTTSLQFSLGNIFWTGLDPCAAFALLFLFISYIPHFTSATKERK